MKSMMESFLTVRGTEDQRDELSSRELKAARRTAAPPHRRAHDVSPRRVYLLVCAHPARGDGAAELVGAYSPSQRHRRRPIVYLGRGLSFSIGQAVAVASCASECGTLRLL